MLHRSMIIGVCTRPSLEKPSDTSINGQLGLAKVAVARWISCALLVCSQSHAALLHVDAGGRTPLPPYDSWLTAATNIQDAIDAASPGDEVVVTNGIYAMGGRAFNGLLVNRVAVTKPLLVRSVSGPRYTSIQGQFAPQGTQDEGAIRCAYLVDGAVLAGFTLISGTTLSWPANQLQDQSGAGVWCESANSVVSNCILVGNSAAYAGGGAYGGSLRGCAIVGNAAGSAGGGAYGSMLENCEVSTNIAGERGGGTAASMLGHCNVTGNRASTGGGAFFGMLKDCTIEANQAGSGGGGFFVTIESCTINGNEADTGGGVDTCELNNSLLRNNLANQGAGAWGSTLVNCTLAGNSAADSGGGAYYCTLTNCIVFSNVASTNGANWWAGTLDHCCTTPLPTAGRGNIEGPPLFADLTTRNYRLQPGSPCINAGLNDCVRGQTDLATLPRVVHGTVDIGAYEFQEAASRISHAWLRMYGFPFDGSADADDPDGDGHSNWQEWRCQTVPTNALSALRLSPRVERNVTNTIITWQSVPGVTYFVERSTNTATTPQFFLLVTNIVGSVTLSAFTDTNAPAHGLLLYRVGVAQGEPHG